MVADTTYLQQHNTREVYQAKTKKKEKEIASSLTHRWEHTMIARLFQAQTAAVWHTWKQNLIITGPQPVLSPQHFSPKKINVEAFTLNKME